MLKHRNLLPLRAALCVRSCLQNHIIAVQVAEAIASSFTTGRGVSRLNWMSKFNVWV
jgi:hypothetical protein